MSEVLYEYKISNFIFKEEDVGRIVKGSKRKYTWQFSFNGGKHFIDLFESKMSGRRKVVADGDIKFPKQLLSFELENFVIALCHIGTTYELRINSCPFDYLIQLENNKKFFTKLGESPDDPSNIKLKVKKSSKFIMNILRNSHIKNDPVDVSTAGKEARKFHFSIKPSKTQEKYPSEVEFKQDDYLPEKLSNDYVVPIENFNILLPICSENLYPDISELNDEANRRKEELNKVKNYGSFSKDIDNALFKENHERNSEKVGYDKDEENMKSDRLNELFDTVPSASKYNFKPYVNIIIEAKVEEKFQIENSEINYPKFENFENIITPQYKEQIKNSENYIQPKTNQYLNDINDFFS